MSRVLDFLGPDGPLARKLPGYENRPGQLQMAEAVEEALEHDQTLVCEAGTGTGKTMAYLVPAILSERKVVVSTATKALQDQILSHDIPAIERHLGLRPRVALAKGLNNYVCLRRLEEFRRSPDSFRPKYAHSLKLIEQWLGETETGDVSELKWLPENDPLWHEICSSPDTRQGGKCIRYRDCFVTRMRREAEEAQIVIANHHLVFADVATREGSEDHAGVLPEHEVLIFDEAHQIEEIASDFFGLRISSRRLDALAHDMERAFRAAGLSDPVLGKGEGSHLTFQVKETAQRFFEELEPLLSGSEPGKRPLSQEVWSGDRLERYQRLDAALDALGAFAKAHNKDEDIQQLGTRATQIQQDLKAIIKGSPESVSWIEGRARSIAIGATPVEVASKLKERIFERIPAVILTSATLATAGRFDFFRSRVGANSAYVKTVELTVPSPFDYPSSALLYTPTDLPEPSDPRFSTLGPQRAAELIELTAGGALVLCTSYRSMTSFREAIAQSWPGTVMMQGEAPKSTLLARLRASNDAVLVATMSFWEGVDVAGDALRLVIIDKIPFAVPTDPVVMARCTALEQAGENPFIRYHVPLAAITLKQGFGRLIRTKKDRGVVAILDRRLVQRGYGRALLASLPPARRTTSLEQVRLFTFSVLAPPESTD